MNQFFRHLILPSAIRRYGSPPSWSSRVASGLVLAATFVLTAWLSDVPALRAVGLGFQDALQQVGRPSAAAFTRAINISQEEYERIFGGRSPLDPDKLNNIITKIIAFRPAVLVIDIDTSSELFRGKLDTGDQGQTKLVWARGRTYDERGVARLDAIAGTPEKDPARTGIAIYPADIDGRFRLFPRTIADGARIFDSIYWAAIKAYCESHACPIDRFGKMDATVSVRPRFRERPGLSSDAWWNPGSHGRAGRQHIPGKIVVLGTRYSEIDRHSTPIGEANGSDIIGQIIEAELGGDLIKEPTTLVKYSLKLGIGLLILLFNHYLWPRWALIASVTIGVSVLLGVALGAFYLGATLFDLMAFTIVIIIKQAVHSAEVAQHRTLLILQMQNPDVT